MDYILAFIVGGLICVIVQILMDNTKLLPGRIMVLLVCSGAVLGAVGVYEPFAKWAGAGATVPLLGFGNVLYQGGFSACAVGVSAALIFGYLGSLIFKPKMKD